MEDAGHLSITGLDQVAINYAHPPVGSCTFSKIEVCIRISDRVLETVFRTPHCDTVMLHEFMNSILTCYRVI